MNAVANTAHTDDGAGPGAPGPSGRYGGPDRRREVDARSQIVAMRFACVLLLAVSIMSVLYSVSASEIRAEIATIAVRLDEHIGADRAGTCD